MRYNFDDMTFWEFASYYYGEHSDVTGELPLMWWDRYQAINDELDIDEAIGD